MYLAVELSTRNVPCWYGLSYTSERLLTVLVHRDILEELQICTGESPIIRHFQETLGIIDDFCGEFQNQFGFGGIIKIDDSGEDQFLQMRVPLPLFVVSTDDPCRYCEGSGKNPSWEDRGCVHCGGSGKSHNLDWLTAYKVVASLSVLFQLLAFPKKETSAHIPQLLTVETIVRKDLHGGSLAGRFSKSLVQWMTSLGIGVSIPEMEQAMINAYGYMNGKELDDWDTRTFRAQVAYKNGWLNVSCPGNACGLNPEHVGPHPDRGYKFDCHNVDSPIQQLTLLAGLAALSDRCLREL